MPSLSSLRDPKQHVTHDQHHHTSISQLQLGKCTTFSPTIHATQCGTTLRLCFWTFPPQHWGFPHKKPRSLWCLPAPAAFLQGVTLQGLSWLSSTHDAVPAARPAAVALSIYTERCKQVPAGPCGWLAQARPNPSPKPPKSC